MRKDENDIPHTSLEPGSPASGNGLNEYLQTQPSSPFPSAGSAVQDVEDDTIPEYQYEMQNSQDYYPQEEEEICRYQRNEPGRLCSGRCINYCDGTNCIGEESGQELIKNEPESRMSTLCLTFKLHPEISEANPKSKSVNKIGEAECKWFQLSPLEQWIILRVRESRREGISAAEGFYRLRDRCVEQSRRELHLMYERQHLLRRLKEIHGLSGGFDPISSTE
ncbi:hypothetical protein R3P38DRAFT_3183357 [Favolaschia claudopus]|uniref:Uncharacterized protein n=1 Tax=Favolaschia claudopus TaxID=2862362 RepID=A0AAW0CE29_9AGAR